MTDEEKTTAAVDRLTHLLDLEELDDNLFRSVQQEEGWKRVYGGQVLGQALTAATRTVEPDRRAHSLHAYFILAGDPKAPIIYQVERARDGRSFSTRRVVAIQHGRPIFNLSCSFQVVEAGFEHQADLPDVPPPEALVSDHQLLSAAQAMIPPGLREFMLRPRAVEFRPVEPYSMFSPGKHPPRQSAWFKVLRPLPDDPGLHRCFLAYISDTMLVGTAALPHPVSFLDPRFQVASLDHAMWFHEDFRVDDWLLYAMDSPKSANARGLARGLIFTRSGRLVATVIQEGLIRLREDPPPVTPAAG